MDTTSVVLPGSESRALALHRAFVYGADIGMDPPLREEDIEILVAYARLCRPSGARVLDLNAHSGGLLSLVCQLSQAHGMGLVSLDTPLLGSESAPRGLFSRAMEKQEGGGLFSRANSLLAKESLRSECLRQDSHMTLYSRLSEAEPLGDFGFIYAIDAFSQDRVSGPSGLGTEGLDRILDAVLSALKPGSIFLVSHREDLGEGEANAEGLFSKTSLASRLKGRSLDIRGADASKGERQYWKLKRRDFEAREAELRAQLGAERCQDISQSIAKAGRDIEANSFRRFWYRIRLAKT